MLATVVSAGCNQPARPLATIEPRLSLAANQSSDDAQTTAVPKAAPRSVGHAPAVPAPATEPAARPKAVASARKGRARYHIGKAYEIAGRWFQPREDPHYDEVGVASFYGRAFHGHQTANGEIFDMNALSAAHPTLPLPSYVRVTNLANDHSVIVRVNDRGPFKRGRLIDVSRRAADMLGFLRSGTARVRVEYVDMARLDGNDGEFLVASYRGPEIPSNPLRDVTSRAPVRVAAAQAPAPRPRRVASAEPAATGTIGRRPDPARFDPFASADASNDGGLVMPAPDAAAFRPAERKRKWLTSVFRDSFTATEPRGSAFKAIDRLVRNPS